MRTSGVLLLVTLICSGCADLVTFNRERYTSEGSQEIFADAKQRVFFSSPVVTTKTTKNKDGDITVVQERVRQFCAEPSPDALSSLASNLGVNLSVQGQGDLGVSQSIAESAANIGIRTRAIQTLRDIMYRNCEGYVNGGITSFGVETLQRRFQSSLVALLAIEQLTSSMPAPSVVLTGTVNGVDAASLAKIVDQVNDSKTALDIAKDDQDKAEKKVTTATSTLSALTNQKAEDALKIATLKKKKPADLTEDETKAIAAYDDLTGKQIPAATEAIKTATAEQKLKTKNTQDRQTDYEATIKIRTVAATSGASVATGGQFAPGESSKTIDKETVGTISAAVTHIVDATLSLGFGREVCATLFGKLVADGRAHTEEKRGSLEGTCIHYLSRDSDLLDSQINQINTQTETWKTWMLGIQTGLQDKSISGAEAVALMQVALKAQENEKKITSTSNSNFMTHPSIKPANTKYKIENR